MSDRCNIVIRPAGRTVFISAEGFLDISTPAAASVATTAAERNGRFAILDIRKVVEIDKDGLTWLLALHDELDTRRIPLKIIVTESGRISRILKLMQYDRFLSLVHSSLQAWGTDKRRRRLRSAAPLAI